MSYWNWIQKIKQFEESGEPFVLALVTKCLGSAPQEEGARMLVTNRNFYGTVGGGRLEKKVIEEARKFLENKQICESNLFQKKYPLGAQFGQCCGGSMEILYERFEPRPLAVIYGAGHVATELVSVLQSTSIDCAVVDYRKEWLEPLNELNVYCLDLKTEDIFKSEIKEEIEDFLKNQKNRKKIFHIIMTYQHDIDLDIVRILLEKSDSQTVYIGLIGSQTKWRKFKDRLTIEGFAQSLFDRVQCPIAPGLLSKVPREIAIGISYEILTR